MCQGGAWGSGAPSDLRWTAPLAQTHSPRGGAVPLPPLGGPLPLHRSQLRNRVTYLLFHFFWGLDLGKMAKPSYKMVLGESTLLEKKI